MKVAVVGSGVSGLAATWLLNEYSDHEVHLYEADVRPGGHANTVSFTTPGGGSVDVDTGFIVFNPCTYPNFLRFLHLDANTGSCIQATDMTFSVSRDRGAYEWGGGGLGAVFCQLQNLLDPGHWRLLYDIVRFNACARRLLDPRRHSSHVPEDISIGEYLRQEGYSSSFRNDYLIPMTAAVWSTPPDKRTLDIPAHTLVQFMYNHHLLQIFGKPSWLTLRGGSRVYVKRILSKLPASQLHLATRIVSVKASRHHVVELTTASGETSIYDHIIFACHSDTALNILRAGGTLTHEEHTILGAFEWTKNVALLHNDSALMPKRRVAWSCWNCLTESGAKEDRQMEAQVSLTYWMNALQHIPEDTFGPVLVTLNPPLEPDPVRVVGRYQYDHPVLGPEAIRAQNEMPKIQGKRGISFAGAWLKYGFHEDGFTSGMRAAAAILQHPSSKETDVDEKVQLPFAILDADRSWVDETHARLLAVFFDLFEGTGLRAVTGTSLSWGLCVIGWLLASVGLHVAAVDMRDRRNA